MTWDLVLGAAMTGDVLVGATTRLEMTGDVVIAATIARGPDLEAPR